MQARILIALLSATLIGNGFATRTDGGMDPIRSGGGGPGPSSDSSPQEAAKDRYNRVQEKLSQVQSRYTLQSIPEAAPVLDAAMGLLVKAKASLDAAYYAQTITLCDQIEVKIMDLDRLGSQHVMAGDWKPPTTSSGPGPGGTVTNSDSVERQEQRTRAQWEGDQLFSQVQLLAPHLQASKDPRAAELLNDVNTLLASARQLLSSNQIQQAAQYLEQAEKILPELNRLANENLDMEKHDESEPERTPNKSTQPASGVTLAHATDLYNRVHDDMERLGDNGMTGANPRVVFLKNRIKELMDKSWDAMGSGQYGASQEFSLKAANLLVDLHSSLARMKEGGADSLKDAADARSQKLRDRWQRASDGFRRLQAARSGSTGEGAASATDKTSALPSLLDQAKLALDRNQNDVAESDIAQCERVLATATAGPEAGGAKSPQLNLDRLKSKLDRAKDIVASSHNDKSEKILEKGLEHFDKAQHLQSSGQGAMAEVEMDIALKLAAKAVDIARSSSH